MIQYLSKTIKLALIYTFILGINTANAQTDPSLLFAKGIGNAYSGVGGILYANEIKIDASGNLYVTGRFQGTADFDPSTSTAYLTSSSGDFFLAKYDASGNYVWAKRIGGTTGFVSGDSLALDGSGNVFVTGSFNGAADFDPGSGTATLTPANAPNGTGSQDIFLAKYDASGNYVWAKSMGGTSTDIGNSLDLDGSGNVVVTGYFGTTVDFDPGAGTSNLTSALAADIFLAKYDASGNYVWAKSMGGTGADIGNSLALDGSGNVVLTGSFNGPADFDPSTSTANLTNVGSSDMFLAKYDASGNYVWAIGIGGTSLDNGYSLALDGSGNVVVTGRFSTTVDFDPSTSTANLTSAGISDIFLAKYDASGNYVWATRMGGTAYDQANSLVIDGSGNVVVTGRFQDIADFDPGAGTANLFSNASFDIFLAKYDASGNYVWAKGMGGSGQDQGNSLVLNGSGNVVVTGDFNGQLGSSSGTVDFDPGAGTTYLTSLSSSQNGFIAAYGSPFVCTNPTGGGTIATAQSGNNPFNPTAFTSSAAASGQAGTLEYKWQSSTTSNSAGFADIATSNAATYDAGALTQTTWFKRLARVTCSADWTSAVASNVLEVTVIAVAAPTAAAQTFCSGATIANLVATGTDLQWYDLETAGTALASTTVLATGTYYVSQTVSGSESTRTSVAVTITPSSDNITTVTACDSYTWNGTVYTTSGIKTGTTTGCVTEKLNLTITPSSDNITTVTACDSYTWNGTVYTTSGIKTGTTTGCVTEKLNLTITTPPAQPVIACYQTASFNATTCTWDVTGTQPVMPTSQPIPNQTYNTLTAFTTNAEFVGYTFSATETFNTLNGFYASGLSGNFGAGTPTWTASAPGGLYCGAAGGSQVLSTNNPVPLTLTFNPGVTALGANIFITDASFNIIPGTITVTFANGSTTSFSTTSANDFFGTTANSALITSISISAIDNAPGDVYVTVDNLVIATGTLNPYTHISYNDLSNFSTAAVTAGDTISATATFETYNGYYASGLSGNFGAGTPTWTASATGGLYFGAAGGSQVLSTNNPVPLTLTFNPGVTGLGANIFITDNSFNVIPGTITVTYANGDTYIFSTTSANDFFGGIGYTSKITSISISAIDNAPGDVYVTVDNLVIATGTINSPLACYQSYVYNSNTCSWEVTGTQPSQPTLACYETATFNTTSCAWDVIGTQDPIPTLACYQTATFNTTSCVWDVTATGGSTTYYADLDGDGFGDASTSIQGYTCLGTPAGYVTNATDCNDAVAAINPGHVEVLYNGVDDNCDGQIDEGFQLTSPLQTVSCGAILPSLGSLIYANINWNATAYRFKVVNNTTGDIQYYINSHHWFALNMLTDYHYATTYTISVELQKAGIWLGYYGSTCEVSSPAILSSAGALQVIPSQCNATLPSIGTVIFTTPVSGATGYRFRVTDVTPGATGDNLIQEKNRSYHWFTLPMLSRFNYGSTYLVEVAVKTTGGYSAYGSACMVYTPVVPMLVSCGTVVPTPGSLVYTSAMNSVSQYRFQVTKVSDQTSVTFDTNKFWFSLRVNVPGYTPATGYSVRVAVMTGGNWSPFGDACEITSPAASSRNEEVGSSVFETQAFPNPFSSEFKLNVTTSTEGTVELRVYDMLGKLLDARTIQAIDFISEDFGTNYPAGVYNVIVTQGEEVKTLRMIKR